MKGIFGILLVALLFCFLQPAEVRAANDDTWVKQIGIYGEKVLILKSNGDLIEENSGEITKLAGNVKNFSLGKGSYGSDILIAVRENGTLYIDGGIEFYKNYEDISSLKDVHKISQSISGHLMYINNSKELYEFGETGKKIMDNVVDIQQGSRHFLALTEDGELWSWGANIDGQLGNGNYKDTSIPQKIMDNVRSIAAHDNTSLAVTKEGKLLGWGFSKTRYPRDVNYVLLKNELGRYNKPELIMEDVILVSITGYNVVALKENKQLWGWGRNKYGELGNDTTYSVENPILILDKVELVSTHSISGDWNYAKTIAVRENGEIWGWGELASGSSLVPIKILDAQQSNNGNSSGLYKNASSWAIPELSKAESKGLLLPVLNHDFSKPVTREKFSEIVMEYYEALIGTTVETSVLNPFSDTVNEKVLQAYSLGIVYGKAENKFKPNDLITREEIAVMLKRALDKGRPEFNYNYQYKRFEDENEFSDWSLTAIKYLRSLEVIQGNSKNYFLPKANTTIQEASIMTYRLLEQTE